MSFEREDPDAILKKIQMIKKEKHQGHLKIFFGYAAGVGKTYAMLKAAHLAKEHGIEVVAGYIEPHARPETMALLQGIEQLPYLQVQHKNMLLHELDLDAAIVRNPQIILVDELAHTNIEQARHLKRYQDIQELLKAGIDVYTTINVQHIESLNDLVASITGVVVRERIPDYVFDEANLVTLVDIEPADLLERLNEGKIYNHDQAEKAMNHFFTLENLVALREIALRRTADRVNRVAEKSNISSKSSLNAGEHILVCLSSSPSNAKIIRTAARMASAFKGNFTALFVETASFGEWSDINKARLQKNMRLAEQLGANIEKVYGEDVAFQISEFARYIRVTKIVIGRSNTKRNFLSIKKSFTEQLTNLSPNLDIYVIPDQQAEPYKKKTTLKKSSWCSGMDLLKVALTLAITTAIGFVFQTFNFSNTDIINMYILGVLVTAIITANLFCSILMATLSVIAFNFFFTYPIFSLEANDPSHHITFLIMFITAFIIGTLASKLKIQAQHSAETAYRTKVLLETNQLLQQETQQEGILATTAKQLVKLLNHSVVFYPIHEQNLAQPIVFFEQDETDSTEFTTDNEQAVAAWVFKNNKHAGATTNTLGSAKCLYLAIRTNLRVYGVIGIALKENKTLDTLENNLVLSMLGECALALEKEHFIRKREEAATQVKNEQLRANLLRAISHDLRSPLTTISGNAHILLSNEFSIDEDKKMRLFEDIYNDAQWLINLVENLLSITSIENGTMNIQMDAELIDEVINEALLHVNRRSRDHIIKVDYADGILIAKLDPRLIVQVLINLIDNAIKYTPVGSEITISTKKENDWIVVDITDNGDGIPDTAKEKIFEMFYTVHKSVSDSRRGIGIGLALCKSIISVHGGSLTVHDHYPKGTIFRFTLQAKEVKIYE
ncbi:histidine kinase [Solibacillus sp. R5-41]|uniref:sensor histidine kinase n=1 Tax=Solibacillus sp. R5-41 TaxID=2048654 RepID=UPI000C125855|nr:sensor histidine kinase KdpD [Solibacillus sp. R5-41]ATP39913.1 histidine kinase [Solibacillus sp. R5-41]